MGRGRGGRGEERKGGGRMTMDDTPFVLFVDGSYFSAAMAWVGDFTGVFGKKL